MNWVELQANPSKTEVHAVNLNETPKLPFEDASFDAITNALSVDYLTSPLDVFREMYRVLRPGGTAHMAFTNRCFPNMVVPLWLSPFDDAKHIEYVGDLYHFSGDWKEIQCVDVTETGWGKDPMYVVRAEK